MNHFHLMTVFVAVAELQGFAAAGRRLQLSPPAVTRAVAALEQQLGVKLLNRTTRHVRTTEVGQRYLEDSRRILADVEAANEAAIGINSEPRGHLSITAPVLFGRMFVMPGIVEYLNTYPDTEISAVFLDRIVNMLEEGQDVGIRIGELPDSSLRALRVGAIRVVLCASPAYLQRQALPQNPQDLNAHSVIASSAGNKAIDWRFESPEGKHILHLQPRLTVTTNDAAIEAAVQDFGITRLFSYQVAPQLVSGELKIVLEDYEPPPRPIYIVHREGRYESARIRAFVDLMAKRLRADKSLN
jgi:DNA-binding transcriptional LysR family regulator